MQGKGRKQYVKGDIKLLQTVCWLRALCMAEEGVFSQCCGVSSTIAAQPNIQTILRGGKRFEFVWLKQVQIKTLGAEGSASAPLERDSRRLSRWFREEERMGYPPPPILGLQRPHCQDAKAPRGGLSGAVSVRPGGILPGSAENRQHL